MSFSIVQLCVGVAYVILKNVDGDIVEMVSTGSGICENKQDVLSEQSIPEVIR